MSRAVTEDGVEYRDLNKNGRLDPYEDPRLPAEERAADLLARLSLEEKAGLLFPTIAVGEPGDHDAKGRFGPFSVREHVSGLFLNHFNVHALPSPRETARWHNALQELAEETPARHPRDHLHRPAPLLQPEHRGVPRCRLDVPGPQAGKPDSSAGTATRARRGGRR